MGEKTLFCSVCDEVSVTVHGDWEAYERYAWQQDPMDPTKWICESCIDQEWLQRQARKSL